MKKKIEKEKKNNVIEFKIFYWKNGDTSLNTVNFTMTIAHNHFIGAKLCHKMEQRNDWFIIFSD